MITEDIIIWLQKILNPAAIEQWGKDNNIQLPIGQIIGMYLKNILNAIVPLSGGVIDYISNDIQGFIKKDPKVVLAELNASGGNATAITQDLSFNLFGEKFTIDAATSSTLLYIGIGGLVLFLAYGFLKE